MKKGISLALLAILAVSFVSFVYAEDALGFNDTLPGRGSNTSANLSDRINDNIQERNEIRNRTNETNATNIGQLISANVRERNQIRKDIREEIRTNGYFTYTTPNGTLVNFTKVDGQLRLRVKNHTINTTFNITEKQDENNNTILVIEGSDGQNRTIKIMPDTAAERALDRLRLKVCNETNNCTIELKDVGANQTRKIAAYELKAEKKAKVFGLFNKKMQVRSEVDAETGSVKTHKPWWSFLASEED